MKSKFVFLLYVVLFFFVSCDKRTEIEKKVVKLEMQNAPSLIIVNNTSEKLMEECNLYTPNGMPVVHQYRTGMETNLIMFEKFDKKYTNLIIELKDRYGIKYKKSIVLNDKGNTKVEITDKDQEKFGLGNLKPKERLERWLNKFKDK